MEWAQFFVHQDNIWQSKSVKCYPGGRKIYHIPSICDILSQKAYGTIVFSIPGAILLVLSHIASMVSARVGLFEHVIYS